VSLAVLREALSGSAPHFSPFLMLGDPDPATSVRLAVASVRAGATMLELGIPFSDPVADGPAIQAAGCRARAAGTTVRGAIDLVREIRKCVDVPLNLLVYANLVHARGADAFVASLADAGASSILVPDLPFEESGELRAACASKGVGLVHFVGPDTPLERCALLAGDATAFVYLAGIRAVTGSDMRVRDRSLCALAAHTSTPLAVGFGLRSPDDVRAVASGGARIAIVGSELARRIEALHEDSPDLLVAEIAGRVSACSNALTSLSAGSTGGAQTCSSS
jgi:tryptophan synthase alpha chain